MYAHPDDPEISAGGTLARWAAAGAEVSVLITTRGDKGTDDPDADLDALARLRIEETAASSAELGLVGHFHLDYGDGELVDDHHSPQSDRPLRARAPARGRALPGPDRGVLRRLRTSTTATTASTGWATLDAVLPAAGNPHYFPEHLAEGLAVHHVRSVYLSGTLDPNCWIDISRHPRAQDRRAVLPREPAHARRGSGSGSSCARARRTPVVRRASATPRGSGA